MPSSHSCQPVFDYIDAHSANLIDRLKEAVAIPSVSGDAVYRPDVFKMADWLDAQLQALGVKTEKRPLGKHVMDGQELDLPPIILGQFGNDPKKKTILVYGHFDVQPALKSDGWNTEPFELTHDTKTDRLYGRGSSDDKGPVLGWLNAIEAHLKTGTEFPVNLKMVFEGMEESGSEGLDDEIVKEAKGFFADVDAVCISDNYWLNTKTPCLTYGLRGISYFKVTVCGPAHDLHSGVFGGTVHEPMNDLVHIFSKLTSPQGEILVPGIKQLVAPLVPGERERYEAIDFTNKDLSTAVGAEVLLSDDKCQTLMGRMREPSLSIHGFEGAFSAPGSKTVIPACVHGKFSIRLVPNMTPDEVESLVKRYLEAEFAKLKSKNKINVESLHGGKPWVADPDHYNYTAAAKATEIVYGMKPDYTREGGSIPVTLTFAEALGKSVMLLPMGRGDDGAHSTNEKLDVSNYIQGTKLLACYLHEVGAAKA